MAHTQFDHDQFSEAYPPGIERMWWQVARKRVIADTFAHWISREQRVLEVGCGTGIITGHLRDRGWKVTGVDLGEPKAGLHASGHLLLGTNAMELPADVRQGIGVLGLFDVIEHIEHAPAFLRALLDAFPNARQVVITVPARQELWTSFDDHFGHFRRYDRPMLRQELSASGLVTDHIGYFFHGLYPAIAINNLLRGRKRNIAFNAPAPGAASGMHAVLGSIFALESRWLPSALPGSSIIAVARRA